MRLAILVGASLFVYACTAAIERPTNEQITLEACLDVRGDDVFVDWTLTNRAPESVQLWVSALPWAPTPAGAKFKLDTVSDTGALDPLLPLGSSTETLSIGSGHSVRGRSAVSEFFPQLRARLERKAAIKWTYDYAPIGREPIVSLAGTLSLLSTCAMGAK